MRHANHNIITTKNNSNMKGKRNTAARLAATMTIALAATACSNDGNAPALTDPQEMCNPKLVGYSQQVTVNGTDTYSCMVEFAKNADDTTKMDMKIVGISPDKTEWNATVTTVPAEGCVRFAGTDSTDNYRLSVEGTWTPPANGETYATVRAACRIERRGSFPALGRKLTFPFTDGWANTYVSGMDEVEYEGQKYSASMAVDSAMTYIARQLARDYEALELCFNQDGTLTVGLRGHGALQAEPWMTFKYWLDGNTMTVEIDDEQAAKVENDWFGEMDALWWEPLFAGSYGRNTLVLKFNQQRDYMSMLLCGHDFSAAMRMYSKGNGTRMADPRGSKWVKIAARAMNDDWIVTCKSEPLAN